MIKLDKYKIIMKCEVRKNEFIKKAKLKYGESYDYSNIEYVNAITPIRIKCNIHNIIFKTTPSNHLINSGCKMCMTDLISYGKEKFIKDAKLVHGNKYDYSKVEYVSNNKHVIIICPKHGEFRQTPHHHLLGQTCIECYRDTLRKNDITNIITTDLVLINKNISKLKKKYPNYTFGSYVHFDKPLEVICPAHGTFYKTPHALLRPGENGCKLCNNNSDKRRNEFIKKAKEKHGDKFDYSKLDMNDRKITIICKKHGEFKQEKRNHLIYDICCPKCVTKNMSISKDEFIKKAKEKFGNKYDYSKVNFVDMLTPVEIICKEHGPFMKIPAEHVRLHRKFIYNYKNGGCSVCNIQSVYEKQIYEYLRNLNKL